MRDKPECHCCGYPAKRMKDYGSGALCEICANTRISNVKKNSAIYPTSDLVALEAIAWGINRVLDEIRKKQ